MEEKVIGFIGIGIMGSSMVRNLLRHGFKVCIYARTAAKAAPLVAEGAMLLGSIAEVAAHSDIIITIVGGPSDVEAVWLGDGGLISNARNGTYLIDMTTSSPELAQRLFEQGQHRGLHVLDIPVTGGDVGARNGTLSLLSGGLKEDLEAVMPVLRAVGSNINHEGGPGCGQHTKAVNQIMVAGQIAGVCEGLAYAKAHGLDLETVLRSVATGAAGSKSLELFGHRIVKGDLNPGGAVKFLVKDLQIALRGAQSAHISLPVSEAILSRYQQMMAQGMGDLGIHALGELSRSQNQH